MGNFRRMLVTENKRHNGDKFTDHFIDQMILKARVGSNSDVGYAEFLIMSDEISFWPDEIVR